MAVSTPFCRPGQCHGSSCTAPRFPHGGGRAVSGREGFGGSGVSARPAGVRLLPGLD